MKAILFLIAGVPAIFHGISLVLLMMFKLESEPKTTLASTVAK